MAVKNDSMSLDATAEHDHGGMLPIDPYRSLRLSFGMLLGVADLETIGAYQRGKMWLHNAWLHGGGCVWGLDVELDVPHGEVRVLPGLAIDLQGRELHLDHASCLNVASWFEQNRNDDRLEITHPNGDESVFQFAAHIAVWFKGCLTRPVPALAEPCEGSETVTSFSRVFETVELRLVPGAAPAVPPQPYHRLRLLFGVEAPREAEGAVIEDDQRVLDRRDEILALSDAERPAALLAAFREFAALDAMDRRPAVGEEGSEIPLFPVQDRTPLVLAQISALTLKKTDSGWKLVDSEVDNTVRPALVATSTIQELLGGTVVASGSKSGGPRVDPASFQFDAPQRAIHFQFNEALLVSSLNDASVSVHSFDENQGWQREQIERTFDTPQKALTIKLKNAPRGSTLRVLIRGTGESPVLGGQPSQPIPFAGAIGGPPGTQHDGHDFAFMFRIG